MTLTDTRPETTLIGLHALYPDASYGLSRLGVYLRTFDDAWRMCNWLALYRFTGRGDFGLGPPLSKAEIDQAPRTSLAIARLQIESPMDLAVVAQGGVTLVAAYSVHLLAQVLRHPDQIGTWLPRLVASWHDGWREAAQAKGLRRSAESASTSAKGRTQSTP
jgi:hypothetical protein